MKGGVRGKYCRRYRAGTNLALLAPDVAKAFPNDEAVNEALRPFSPEHFASEAVKPERWRRDYHENRMGSAYHARRPS